jgi:hypothetical protein
LACSRETIEQIEEVLLLGVGGAPIASECVPELIEDIDLLLLLCLQEVDHSPEEISRVHRTEASCPPVDPSVVK